MTCSGAWKLDILDRNARMRGMGRPRERKGRRGSVAERLRAARAARGLTQHQAAAELGILPPVLAAYETGARHPSGLAWKYLSLWTAAALGEALDIPWLEVRR